MSENAVVYIGAYLEIDRSRFKKTVPVKARFCETVGCKKKPLDVGNKFCSQCGKETVVKQLSEKTVYSVEHIPDLFKNKFPNCTFGGSVDVQLFFPSKLSSITGRLGCKINPVYDIAGLICNKINAEEQIENMREFLNDIGLNMDEIFGEGNWDIKWGVISFDGY